MVRTLAIALVVLTGCVRFDYTRDIVDSPVAESGFETLTPGMTLQECLDTLGAPGYVWSDPRGVWLAYIWIRETKPRIAVSVPFLTLGIPGPSPSFTYSVLKRRGEGITLCFNQDLELRFARQGLTDLPESEPG